MALLKRREIDRIYNALRPRINRPSGGVAYTPPTVTIPPHTHSADQITSNASTNVAADDVQEAIEELDAEKLAIDGTMTMTGHLDMGLQDIDDAQDVNAEGTVAAGVDVTAGANVTVGAEIVQTGAVGSATLSGTRKITMAGDEADGEGRIEEVNAIAFNAVGPTPELARAAWDVTEGILSVFVESGSGLVLVASSWAVKMAFNYGNPV